MSPEERESFIQRAKHMYAEKWKATLEAEHHGEYLAIEPISEEYFFGKTLSEATAAARKAHPGRWTYGLWIGYSAAAFIGTSPS